MTRRARRGQRGAESLEFVACVGLLLLLAAGIERAVAVWRLEGAAESDARVLARQEAVCDGTRPFSLAQVDPAAARGGGWVSRLPLPGGLFDETVHLPLRGLLPGALGREATATVRMAYESGCAR